MSETIMAPLFFGKIKFQDLRKKLLRIFNKTGRHFFDLVCTEEEGLILREQTIDGTIDVKASWFEKEIRLQLEDGDNQIAELFCDLYDRSYWGHKFYKYDENFNLNYKRLILHQIRVLRIRNRFNKAQLTALNYCKNHISTLLSPKSEARPVQQIISLRDTPIKQDTERVTVQEKDPSIQKIKRKKNHIFVKPLNQITLYEAKTKMGQRKNNQNLTERAREILKHNSIGGKPNYTPEKLVNLIAKEHYNKPAGTS